MVQQIMTSRRDSNDAIRFAELRDIAKASM
jgi:hypothetical protein